jgi:hypothetical protein
MWKISGPNSDEIAVGGKNLCNEEPPNFYSVVQASSGAHPAKGYRRILSGGLRGRGMKYSRGQENNNKKKNTTHAISKIGF